jgi:8-oxo-dGTP diphosphatase
VDCAVIGRDGAATKVLLIRRKSPPFAGSWALPGGFVELQETLEQAALRELHEETGIRLAHADQLRAFDAVQRDPRERVISIAFLAAVDDVSALTPTGGDDASEAAWFDVDALPALAFDHPEVLATALRRYHSR